MKAEQKQSSSSIALTIGDPTGIGPEIAVKALQQLDQFPDLSLIILGSMSALQQTAQYLNLPLPTRGKIDYRAIEDATPGLVAYQAVEQAVALIAAGDADAMVTGPISKRNLKAAGYAYPGHTEILEEMARRYFGAEHPRAEMLFVHDTLRLMLLTRHAPLRDVSAHILQPDAVDESFSILINFLRRTLKLERPRLAVLGVNPHAGEIGGIEEEKILKPIMLGLDKTNLARCDGPLPADAFFRSFKVATNPYDAIIAAYHDQGLIPFKMLAGYAAVNVTIGLPFLRASVSHGTGDDIVGKGIADESSLLAALRFAISTLSQG